MRKTLHSYLPISCICSYRLHMIEKQKQRTIIFYKDYFENFFVGQRAVKGW